MGIFSKKKDAQVKTEKEKSDIEIKKTEKSVKIDNEKEKKAKKDFGKEKIEKKKTVKKDLKETGAKDKTVKKDGNAYRILVKPLITEKATEIGALNKYVFEVDKGANKIEIAKAIEEVYGVKPLDINIIRMKGKKVRYGRTLGKKKDWKKAIITLEKGKTIKIYEGV
jgi:large subunit ribosomal protein L23